MRRSPLELRKIRNEKTMLPFLLLDILHEAPTKPQEGMVVVADGTDWDPGSGAGIYLYLSSSWSKL